MTTSVSELLDKHGLKYRRSGADQFQVQECVTCGDRGGHFYIHRQTGLWHCKKCNRRGNLWHIRRIVEQLDPIASVSDLMKSVMKPEKEVAVEREITEEEIQSYVAQLYRYEPAIQYLLGRGFHKDTIRRFKIGLKFENNAPWITIPYYREGRPVNIKSRTLPPHEKTFRLVPGADLPLFNEDHLKKDEPVFVTEGEFDAMTLIQNGYENTVSIPTGCASFSPDNFDTLVDCGKIYLVYDSDIAGCQGAKEAAARLGGERCFYIKLPVKDVNDFFKQYRLADFQSLVEDAKTLVRGSVLSIPEVLEELREFQEAKERGELVGIKLISWRNVSDMIGEIEPGWLVVLQARPKIGKTTFCLQFLKDIALTHCPVMMFCLEEAPIQTLKTVLCQVRRIPRRALDLTNIERGAESIFHIPLYFGRVSSVELSAEKVFETIRYAVRRFGVKLVVFDHLHFLCRSIKNVVSQTGRVIRDFKLLFEDLRISGVVITHTVKGNVMEVPGLYASRDTAEIAGDADMLMTMHRNPLYPPLSKSGTTKDSEFATVKDASYKKETLIRVTGARFIAGGQALLYWNENTMSFEVKDPNPASPEAGGDEPKQEQQASLPLGEDEKK